MGGERKRGPVSSVWVIGGTAKTCRGQRRRASGTGAKATRTGIFACASGGGGGGGAPPPARPTRWRGMAPDSGDAGGDFFWGGSSWCRANGSHRLVVAAHFGGAVTAPAWGSGVRMCTGLALRTSGISGSVSRAQGPDSLRTVPAPMS